MKPDYDVLIIGSGFGGSVSALRLTEKGYRVGVLEAGRRFSDEEFAKTSWDLRKFLWAPRLGCYGIQRIHPLRNVMILAGAGVGGGSLIYSNVTLEPYRDIATSSYPVTDDWPADAKLTPADYANGLAWMTAKRGPPVPVVTKYPGAIPSNQLGAINTSDPRLLGRSRFLRDASTSPTLPANLKTEIVEPWKALSLQVAEADPANPATNHNYCERQGRCFLGCLPGARHTLNKTLLKNLPLAAQDRVFVRPLAEVDFIEPIAEGYTVHYTGLEDGGGDFHPTAKSVVLAAGCLGSTEILLRSREKTHGQLKLSDKLGTKFSTNGDFSGFITIDRDKLGYPIYANRGPINTSHVTFRNGKVLVNVEDAGIPSMFASLVERTLNMIADNKQANLVDLLGLLWDKAELPDYRDPANMETESEMLMNTSWFNCMGRDDAAGKFDLHNGRLRLTFSQPIANHPTFKMAEEILRGMATAMNGKFHPFPLWDGLQPFVSRKLVVTHPLGGCPEGSSSSEGVVNAKGQVFNTASGAQTVNPGLYVADGSVIPGPLAVNPTLTIVSTALRVAANMP